MIRLLTLLAAFLLALPALAANRHALVIGIDDYSHVAPLLKARNDAMAIAATLEQVGFQTDLVLDADQLEMATSLARLANRITPGDEVVFFFAGHGVEIEGRNYLLPADVPMANPGQEIVLLSRAMEVATILDTLRGQGARISLLILDACRDNPFPQQGTRSLGGRRGLARVAAPEGTFIMFSAGDGQAALDRLSENDPNPNSVFTRALLPRLAEPGLPIHQLARDVRAEVRQIARSVDHEQFPAVYDQFDGEFALLPAGSPVAPAPQVKVPPAAATASPCDKARSDWTMISTLTDPAVIEAFLSEYAECSIMAAIARSRLAALSAAEAQTQAQTGTASQPTRLVPENSCAVQIASFESRGSLANFVATLPDFIRSDVQVFETMDGDFAVTLGIIAFNERDRVISRHRSSEAIPSDAFCHTGNNYVAQVSWSNLNTTRDILRIRDPQDGWLNFRTGPGTSHSIIRRLDNGTLVQVLRRSGRWAEVRTSRNEQGWIFESLTERVR